MPDLPYLSPDAIYTGPTDDYYTFIYSDKLGLLSNTGLTHAHILFDKQVEQRIYQLYPRLIGKPLTKEMTDKYILCGRYGYGYCYTEDVPPEYREYGKSYQADDEDIYGGDQYDFLLPIMSFWNANTNIYETQLHGCLEAIRRDAGIEPEIICTPASSGWAKDVIREYGHRNARKLGDEDQKRIEMMRQLHLMRADQKKDASDELGLIGGGHKRPIQKGMEDAGLVLPGHKYWAPHSESRFDAVLDRALNESE